MRSEIWSKSFQFYIENSLSIRFRNTLSVMWTQNSNESQFKKKIKSEDLVSVIQHTMVRGLPIFIYPIELLKIETRTYFTYDTAVIIF
jgi:hypothetical protein